MANHPNRKKVPAEIPPNRIWIEFEKPRDKEHAQQQCDLANNMLRRLSHSMTEELNQEFFLKKEPDRFSYCYGGQMGYYDLPQRGHWLSLDFIGRPLSEKM